MRFFPFVSLLCSCDCLVFSIVFCSWCFSAVVLSFFLIVWFLCGLLYFLVSFVFDVVVQWLFPAGVGGGGPCFDLMFLALFSSTECAPNTGGDTGLAVEAFLLVLPSSFGILFILFIFCISL